MQLETVSGYQMASKTVCSSVNRACSIGVLIILLFAAGFSGLGLLSIALTLLVLLSSTLLVAFSKQNSSEQTQNMEALEVNFESFGKEGKEVEEEEEEEDCDGQVDDSMAIRSPDSLYESEFINPSSTSEDSEVDWPLDRSPECSDGSISDEESLIEIAIPSGHYIVGHKEEAMYQKFYKKMHDFSPDSIFRGNNVINLLGEMNEMINEEDNLIEIDISMGSIKCTGFVIEA